jgi:hypothetical protein
MRHEMAFQVASRCPFISAPNASGVEFANGLVDSIRRGIVALLDYFYRRGLRESAR